MSHVNPLHPNIYQDKLAASNGIDLHNPMAKCHLIPHKDYRHCADAQVYTPNGQIAEQGVYNYRLGDK